MHKVLSSRFIILSFICVVLCVTVLELNKNIFNGSTYTIERTNASLDVEHTGVPCVHSTANGDLFSWNVADAKLSYEYYIDPFGTPTDSSVGAVYDLGAPANEGWYYMMAILQDGNGRVLAQSPILDFKILKNSPPPVEPEPTLSRTSATLDVYHTGKPISHSTANGVLFSWNVADATLSYEYYIDPFGTPTDSSVGAVYDLGAPANEGWYYMMAILRDSNGRVLAESPILDFKILKNSPPPVEPVPTLSRTSATLDVYHTGKPILHSTANGDLFVWSGSGTLRFEYFDVNKNPLPASPKEVGKYYLVGLLDYKSGIVDSGMLEFNIFATDPNLRQVAEIKPFLYNGSAISISTKKGEIFDWDGNGILSIEFFKDKLYTIPTSSDDGAVTTGSAPKKPNIYYIKAILSSADGYSHQALTGIEVVVLRTNISADNKKTIQLSTNKNYSNTYDLYSEFNVPRVSGKWKIISTTSSLQKVGITQRGQLIIQGSMKNPITEEIEISFSPDELYLTHVMTLKLEFIERSEVSLKISLQDKVFDGLMVVPTIHINNVEYKPDEYKNLKLSYYTMDRIRLPKAPVEPGEYLLEGVVDGVDEVSKNIAVSFSIAPKKLYLENISVKDKLFDGTDSVELSFSNVKLKGLVAGFDSVNLDYSDVRAKFENKFDGGRILVDRLALTGANSNCYILAQPELDARILPLPQGGVSALDGGNIKRTESSTVEFDKIFASYPEAIKQKFPTADKMNSFMHERARTMFSDYNINSYELFDVSSQIKATKYQLVLGHKCNDGCEHRLLHMLPDGSVENVPLVKMSVGLVTENKVSLSPFMLLHITRRSPQWHNIPIITDYTSTPETYWAYVLQRLLEAEDGDVVVVKDIGLLPIDSVMELLRERPSITLILSSERSQIKIYSESRMRVKNPNTGR